MFPFSRRSLVVLGAGLAAGYLLYRYRDALLARARSAAEQTEAIMRGPRARLAGLQAADTEVVHGVVPD